MVPTEESKKRLKQLPSAVAASSGHSVRFVLCREMLLFCMFLLSESSLLDLMSLLMSVSGVVGKDKFRTIDLRMWAFCRLLWALRRLVSHFAGVWVHRFYTSNALLYWKCCDAIVGAADAKERSGSFLGRRSNENSRSTRNGSDTIGSLGKSLLQAKLFRTNCFPQRTGT